MTQDVAESPSASCCDCLPGCAIDAVRRPLRRALLAGCASLASAAASLPADSIDEAAETRDAVKKVKEQLSDAMVGQLPVASFARTLSHVSDAGAGESYPSRPSSPSGKNKSVRIFIDGVFDLMHFGHMNAFRQAKSLGGVLVVGVNSDESVKEAKGMLPVLNDEERQVAVAACRFVDEIVPGSPYVMTEEYIEDLVNNKGIDYFVHGDDPCIVNGKDVYEAARKAGRFFTIPRTEGVSTTDIIGRSLLVTKDHHTQDIVPSSGAKEGVFACQQSTFLVSSQLLRAFSGSLPRRSQTAKEQKVVYVDGAWDMFHCGHISLLQRARELGDYLVVGVHSDTAVNQHRGANYPVMNMQERVLSVMGCKYVDDVLLDAPWAITREMVATLQISVVVAGRVHDPELFSNSEPASDPHAIPKELGIHKELESKVTLTVEEITNRLQSRRVEISKRQKEKASKEKDWYMQKHGITSSESTGRSTV
eukprot:TRINITY_DN19889_c1_g1_i1.p1 TRINITY_DN19889_c1_g1~~TRINITY_DN19889_c1_g1_i1.p1  ORF type:complete len:478 (+),score=84.19 TRINITY_DN19889_c1_g1_i1:90-1523(+)